MPTYTHNDIGRVTQMRIPCVSENKFSKAEALCEMAIGK